MAEEALSKFQVDPSESVGVTIAPDEKVAALFFDRVMHNPFNGPIPREVSVYRDGIVDAWTLAYAEMDDLTATPFTALIPMGINLIGNSSAAERDSSGKSKVAAVVVIDPRTGEKAFELEGVRTREGTRSATRQLCKALFDLHGIKGTPVFGSEEDQNEEFRSGKMELILAPIRNLGIADNSKLKWEQVLQFRKDKEALVKFRRLRNWLDREMVGKPISFVSDAIAAKLYDYEWAIKKHGIETFTGTISQLLDWKVLASVGATAGGLLTAGEGFLAALAGAGIIVGRAAISVTEKWTEIRDVERGPNSEVAFVYDIKRLQKKKIIGI